MSEERKKSVYVEAHAASKYTSNCENYLESSTDVCTFINNYLYVFFPPLNVFFNANTHTLVTD